VICRFGIGGLFFVVLFGTKLGLDCTTVTFIAGMTLSGEAQSLMFGSVHTDYLFRRFVTSKHVLHGFQGHASMLWYPSSTPERCSAATGCKPLPPLLYGQQLFHDRVNDQLHYPGPNAVGQQPSGRPDLQCWTLIPSFHRPTLTVL